MTSLARTAGEHGALFDLSGAVSNNATWDEYIYFREAGVAVVLTGLSFQFQFRNCEGDTSVALSLSTASGQLVITNDDEAIASILRINVAYSVISGLEGDYVADLVAKDSNSKLIHYAHGIVSFRQNPVAF